MNVTETPLKGLYLIEPTVFEDDRGYFFESFNLNVFRENGIDVSFVQDNQSKSQKNVLRGLHFQNPPQAQGKLVGVVKGSVFDVAVDIRIESPTFGQSFSILLSENNKKMMYLSEGFAHGFLTLEDETIFNYKCTDFYNPSLESAILWNDERLSIEWPSNNPILSEKDKEAMNLEQFESKFSG